MKLGGKDIRVSVEKARVPDLSDDGVLALMEQCLIAAEEARVAAVNRSTALKEIFRRRQAAAGHQVTAEDLQIYEDGEGNRDGEWKKHVADNNWNMNRVQMYAAVLQARVVYRQSRHQHHPGQYPGMPYDTGQRM